jgi:ABC-2 type transport system permease protein
MRTNSFRIFTIGLFLFVLAAIVVIDRAPEFFEGTSADLAIPADSPAALRDALAAAADAEDIDLKLVSYADVAEARTMLDEGDVDASLEGGRVVYQHSDDTRLTATVSRALYAFRLQQGLEDADVDPATRDLLLNPAPVEVEVLHEGAASDGERQLIGFAAALSLYLTLAIYGNWILTGVVEEKATRVVEVLLGLVRPYELLAGKTIGILTVAIGQLVIAVIGAIIAFVLTGATLPAVAADVVLAAVPLYVAGLVLYSLIYAAVGATVSRQADAQAASTPIAIILLVPYLFSAIFIPQAPDSGVATVLSVFPLTSPMVMPSRVATGDPGAIELAACYLLLVPAIVLVAWIGGRIYSGVILSGGKPGFSMLVAAVTRPSRAS